jgi:hypothetical protein
MQKCLTCGVEYQVGLCPTCAEGSLPSTGDIQKALNKCSLLLAPGVLVGLAAYVIYPLLDGVSLIAFGLLVLCTPFVLQLLSIIRKRLADDVPRLRTAYFYSSLALLVLAMLPLLNGWLDRSPASQVRTTVLWKTETHRKGSTGYRLTVSSWRPGHNKEEFVVGSHTYNNTFVGKTITVEMHQGFFGLPWYESVSSK